MYERGFTLYTLIETIHSICGLPQTIRRLPMNRILKIGMDVHSTSHTLCFLEPTINGEDKILWVVQVKGKSKYIVDAISRFKAKYPIDEFDIECGYEAGCLGYSLYHDLTSFGLKCVILAPTTMEVAKGGKKIKNDNRDSIQIAHCLAYGGYSKVHIPTSLDNAVKEYIRMRDDIRQNLKSIRQQILAFLLRNGKHYTDGSNWTKKHIKWINEVKFLDPLLKETLNEYMIEYFHLLDRVEKLDLKIEEIASEKVYVEKVNRLKCFIGVKTHTALSLIVETSDFNRFSKGNIYAAYLGLIPGQDSSNEKDIRLGITKTGNRHLRRLLTEASCGYAIGMIGFKSKDLKLRQSKCSSEVIAYADKANERLRKKYRRMIRHGKKVNVAKIAVARELACFVWGMMTDNISLA